MKVKPLLPYQRVALFILFDAIERDLITTIRSATLNDDFMAPSEREKAHARLAKSGNTTAGTGDSDLIVMLDLGDKYEIALRTLESGPVFEYLSSLRNTFVKTISVRNDVMHGRPLTIDH